MAKTFPLINSKIEHLSILLQSFWFTLNFLHFLKLRGFWTHMSDDFLSPLSWNLFQGLPPL